MTLVTSVIGIPMAYGGRSAGCERAPQAYRDAGLINALNNISDNGDLSVSPDESVQSVSAGISGLDPLLPISETIRAGVQDLLNAGEKPLLLGGDGALLIGVAAALRDIYGRAGLAFIDGHIHNFGGQDASTGEKASMELAMLTDAIPSPLTGLAGEAPLVFPSDVTVLGVRDLDEARTHSAGWPDSAIRIFAYDPAKDHEVLADLGKQTASRFSAEPGRFWLHLDLDVLSREVISAADYPAAGGFDWEQLRRLVRPLVSSAGFLGMDVTGYNPVHDADGSYAIRLTEFLGEVLAS